MPLSLGLTRDDGPARLRSMTIQTTTSGSTTMTTAHCYICGRWNDPTGGPDAHSGGCENTGRRYDGTPARDMDVDGDGCVECGDMRERPDGLCHPCASALEEDARN